MDNKWLAKIKQIAHRDDWMLYLVGSDIRQLIVEIELLWVELKKPRKDRAFKQGVEAAAIAVKKYRDDIDQFSPGSPDMVMHDVAVLDKVLYKIKEAKQQTGEADSREFVSPASPSPGSVSPVDSTKAKHPAGGDYAERAQFRDTIAKQAHAEGMKSEANANNADHRDGGYAKGH